MTEKRTFLDVLGEKLGFIAGKISGNKYITALSHGFMSITMITLGVSFFSIIANLPIGFLQDFFASSGLGAAVNGALSVTLSMLGIYVVFAIGYAFAKNEGLNPITHAIMTTAVYFILMPLTTPEGMGSMIDISYMGSKGIIVAIIVGLATSAFYAWLSKKNLKLKLPEAVPPMVSQSLEPMWAAMIIFSLAILLKYGFSFLPGGNFFDFIQNAIAGPLSGLALTPATAVLMAAISNFVWWLGIHPSAFNSIVLPFFLTSMAANSEAFLAGQPLPYLMYFLMGAYTYIGGQGNTLALACLFPFAKSEKYKSMGKLVILPNLFNINEPVIFGVPVMLNPYYLIPMVMSSVLAAAVTWVIISIGFVPSINPTIMGAWVMPVFISNFLNGGWKHLALTLVAFAVMILVYYPFFRMDDKRTYEEEQKRLAELKAEGAE